MPRNPVRQQPFRGLKSPPKPAKSRPKTFADAMKDEGTVPLHEGVRRVPPARASRPRAATPSAPSFLVERDEEWLDGRRVGLSERALARLRMEPMATLDLHRKDAETARRLVTRFVAEERARRRDVVLIVVGRGRHSPGGHGVLRSEIADWLTTPPAAAHVLAFRTARPTHGGSGGVVVLLADSRRD